MQHLDWITNYLVWFLQSLKQNIFANNTLINAINQYIYRFLTTTIKSLQDV